MIQVPTLAVTGSTGALGGRVARNLAASGIGQRLLARTPGRAPELPGAIAVPFSYADRAAATAALVGVQTLFMVSAAEAADRLDQHRAFVDAAVEAGVRQLVYTSFLGAAPDCTFTLGRDHFATEQHIRDTGIDFTFLRDNFYLDFIPDLVGADGVIRGPAGDGRVSAVSRDDIGRVAAAVLAEPDAHRGATYDLTGPEAITLGEAAELITRHSGRTVSFHHETIDEAYASRRRWPAPEWQYDAWVSTYTAIAAGELAEVTDDVERLTGRAPIGLAELLDSIG
ncbi:SDR family oxidoreductase [Microlunatus soli]|uniref:Uncharacterized conserved protein YbjT, contains NAD(P)-binding and DUF2867 domains n=1 Tax=Microlunatus soli TaxID=630515 RepID=A0A1H1UTL8_9ACTN|nr:SDR family oxidoreductase [Microlunatus soli]SDS75827.1 Uncharacterized conserved protein YbjT, contains NAD(P)-binding and DUF2867 domains [Microlunatus soli]